MFKIIWGSIYSLNVLTLREILESQLDKTTD